MSPSRRVLLAAFGAALAAPVAGCSESDSTADEQSPTAEPSPTPEPTRTGRTTGTASVAGSPASTGTASGPVTLDPGEAYATDAGWSVAVENLAVRASVVEHGPTHWDPRWTEGGQFVAADLVVRGDGGPDPADLPVACRTDTVDGAGRVFVAADSNRDDRRQRVAFPVPASPEPTDGAVVWTPEAGPEVRWRLPDAVLAAVARPPAFELREFAVEHAPGDEVDVTLTVANAGEGDGTFLAEVGAAAMSDQGEVTVDVSAGETRTVTRRVYVETDAADETTVVLRWRGETLERTVGPAATATDPGSATDS